jgi:hypothetical protein
MKNIIIIISILFLTNLSAQFPTIVNKNTFKNSTISSLIKTKNGNLVLTGYMCSLWDISEDENEEEASLFNKHRLWAAELDSNGKTIWSKILTDGKKDSVRGKFIAEGDSGFLILTDKSQLVKIDNSGNIKWEKKMGYTSKLLSANNGGYILLGKYEKGNVWLYKITDNGDVQWKITKSQYNAGRILDIQKTIDNQYIVFAYNNENGVKNMRLVKFNNEGKMTWEKNLSYDFFAKSAYHMGNFIQDKLGNYIIATTERHRYRSDIRVTKISEEGTILFSKLYGLGIGENKKYCEMVGVIVEANNGGYIFGGEYYKSGSMHSGYDLCIFRIDENGKFLWYDVFRGGNSDQNSNFISLQAIEGNKYIAGLVSYSPPIKDTTSIVSITDNFDDKLNPMLCPVVE